MKQLKFMIAAAAAIGLAGAAQAAFPSTDKDALGNTGFEEFADGAAVTTGTLGKKFENGVKTETDETDSYFWYTGDVAADNESKIKAGSSGLPSKAPRAKGDKFNADANVLEVNTGTAPLLRTINRVVTNEGQEPTAASVAVPDTGIYIDTLVQFTVTPAGDTVTPTADDKLMIYLQEVAPVMAEDGETVATPGATNLMVMAGYYNADGVIETKPYKLNNVDVEPGVWYRLTVRAYANITGDDKTVISGFTIGINGQDYNSATPVVDDIFYDDFADCNEGVETKLVFPSRITGDATLKAVGFAGEGKVDDIVFSTTQQAIETSVDFTLVAEGVSSVWTTIGNEKIYWTDGKLKLPAGTTSFAINYEPIGNNFWNPQYTEEFTQELDCDVNGLMVTIDGANPGVTFTVTATEGASAPTVGDNDPASSVGIITPAFSSDKGAALQKVVDWAVKAGLTKAELNAMPPFEATTGDATNTLQEAFLLNCAVEDLGTAKAAFKVSAFSVVLDENGVPQVTAPTTESWNDGTTDWNFNGTPDIRGAATLNGAYGEIDANSKFFKAFLVK